MFCCRLSHQCFEFWNIIATCEAHAEDNNGAESEVGDVPAAPTSLHTRAALAPLAALLLDAMTQHVSSGRAALLITPLARLTRNTDAAHAPRGRPRLTSGGLLV